MQAFMIKPTAWHYRFLRFMSSKYKVKGYLELNYGCGNICSYGRSLIWAILWPTVLCLDILQEILGIFCGPGYYVFLDHAKHEIIPTWMGIWSILWGVQAFFLGLSTGMLLGVLVLGSIGWLIARGWAKMKEARKKKAASAGYPPITADILSVWYRNFKAKTCIPVALDKQ